MIIYFLPLDEYVLKIEKVAKVSSRIKQYRYLVFHTRVEFSSFNIGRKITTEQREGGKAITMSLKNNSADL